MTAEAIAQIPEIRAALCVGLCNARKAPLWQHAPQCRARLLMTPLEAEIDRLRAEVERQTKRAENAENQLEATEIYGPLARHIEGQRDEAWAQVEALREAGNAVMTVACVANDGDPWYCEHEGIDAVAALARWREVAGEKVEQP